MKASDIVARLSGMFSFKNLDKEYFDEHTHDTIEDTLHCQECMQKVCDATSEEMEIAEQEYPLDEEDVDTP